MLTWTVAVQMQLRAFKEVGEFLKCFCIKWGMKVTCDVTCHHFIGQLVFTQCTLFQTRMLSGQKGVKAKGIPWDQCKAL